MEPMSASHIEDQEASLGTALAALATLTNGVDSSTEWGTGTHTPKLNSFSLTEYTTYPTPPSEPTHASSSSLVPGAFLLPNGTPDVCL
jgi:hypothetical protein